MKRQSNALKQWMGPVSICLAGTLTVYSTLAFLSARQGEIATRLEAYDSLRRIINQGSTGVAESSPKSEQTKLLFHEGESVELVDANISTLLKEFAAKHSVEITRSGNVAMENSGGTRWATVAVEVTGLEAAIYNFVRQIETSKPALFVTKLQLRGNVLPGSAEAIEIPMSSEMTISGAMLPVATD